MRFQQGQTAALPLQAPPGLDIAPMDSNEQGLRLALLTTASMIGLLRNQFDQVELSLPQMDDKFHAIFRSKLSNLSADLLEFQSLLPVAEQMFCSAAMEPEQNVAEITPESTPILNYTAGSGIDAERMNIFLCSKEADAASNHDTPPPSVAWTDDWARKEKPQEESPRLPINEDTWGAHVQDCVPRATSKDSGEEKKSKKSDAQPKKKEALTGKKKALVKFIYMLMSQKGLTDPNGHLLMDVYVEIWNEVVGGQGCGGRAGFHRFAEMLRSAPEYFEVFHIGIAVDENGGSFASKQRAKMVRLVPQAEVVDEELTPRYRS